MPIQFDITKVTKHAIDKIAKYGPVGIAVIFSISTLFAVTVSVKSINITAMFGGFCFLFLSMLIYSRDREGRMEQTRGRLAVDLEEAKGTRMKEAARQRVSTRKKTPQLQAPDKQN